MYVQCVQYLVRQLQTCTYSCTVYMYSALQVGDIATGYQLKPLCTVL